MPVPQQTKEKGCFICKNTIKNVDYKDVDLLKRFTTAYGKIMPRRRSGACAKHQRVVANAVKNARIMGFMPFVVD
ncbi:MAG: 30S ribosomal protein S18 [Parcubacteria group bacterium]|nr:30S ribosomal protein S18 [Parcubacteria group bacterium]MBI2637216.1 30S ribosomal protein S18 [Parcubacteria group bacterium]